MKRMWMIAAAGALLSGAASGYYHFVHYPGPTAPYPPIFEKFDVTALPNNSLLVLHRGDGSGDDFLDR